MRPRLNAGDDEQAFLDLAGGLVASMRPRLNAGDDVLALAMRYEPAKASMRPRLNAGDDGGIPRTPADRPTRFNEAPAKCRG